MIKLVKAWLSRRKCRRHGHLWVERVHYMRDAVVTVRRCSRCPEVDSGRTGMSRPKQYPLPRVNGKAIR